MPFRLPGSGFPSASHVRPYRPIFSALSAALLGFGLAAGQSVHLQGTLQDRYTGAPIEGAEVTLAVQGLRTFTDSAGRFEIRRVPTRLGPEGSKPLVRLSGGGLAFSNPEPALVTVRILDAQGRYPARGSRARLGAGEWIFHPGRLPQGLYFLSLETPGGKRVIRLPILENVPSGYQAPGFSRAAMAGAYALAKTAGAAIDTLRITKAGYLPGAEPLLSLSQTGMIAQLKDSGSTLSALAGLMLANATLQPPFQSGISAYHAAVRESVQTLTIDYSAGKAKPILVLLGNGVRLPSPTSPIPLDTGMNVLEIRSTSQDGSTTTTYAIQIHRARDTVSSLRDLRGGQVAGTLFPEFQSHVLAYKSQISRSAASSSLTASWDEPLATVRINGILQVQAGSGQIIGFPADQDSIRATVEVESPDGLHASTYTVDFLREPPPPPPPTDSAGLASVTTSLNATLVPAWSPAITAYRLEVQDTASTLALTYTPNSSQAFIKAGSNDWQQGTVVENLPFKGSPQYLNHPVAIRNGTDTTRYTFTIVTVLSKIADLEQMTASPKGSGPSFQAATMRDWTLIFGIEDSVVDIKPVASNRYAKVVLDGKVVPYNTIARLALQPGDNSFLLSVTSQEGSLTKNFTLTFGRLQPKSPVTPPSLAGPDRGFVYAPYAYTFKPSSETCLKGMTLVSRIEWGDGQWQQQGGDYGLPSPYPFGTHVWRAPGSFNVKAVSFCHNDHLTLPGDTSAPILVQIRDTDNGGKVRTLSGPRMASETWSPDTLYRVVGNTLFETGTTLTILPGTTVLFPNQPTPYYIAIHGGLSAVGTPSDSIRFEGPGSVRLKWQGPLTYHPDGSYQAGPRFEYVTFQNGSSPYLDETGGYGFYMKHSRVPLVTAEFSKYARGSYIEHCRFGDFSSVMLDNSRILNSYFDVLSVNAGGSSTLTVNRCEIRTLKLGFYSSDTLVVRISGNTLGTVQGGWSAAKMHGNNILGNPPGSDAPLCYQAMEASTVNLQDNYWGEIATAEMVAKGPNQDLNVIHDYFDDVARGKADYSSWKSAPVPDARPDW